MDKMFNTTGPAIADKYLKTLFVSYKFYFIGNFKITDFNSFVSGTCETIRYPSLNIKFDRINGIGKHDNNTNFSHRHIRRI